MHDIIGLAYESYNRAKPYVPAGYDRDVRHPEYTRQILDRLGRPDERMYNIAVTGSKGKGSHALILAAALQRMGLRVGLFTGPHLVDFMERIRIDGATVPESRFASYMREVHRIVGGLAIPQNHYVGPVGILAAVAALWFRDEGTDVNVFELGRGALHDDVNQVCHRGAVLAPVFLEHPRQLGPTLADVAREKAGVVTDAVEWVSSHLQHPEVDAIVRERCRHTGAMLEVLGQDVLIDRADAPDHVALAVGTRSPRRSSGARFVVRFQHRADAHSRSTGRDSSVVHPPAVDVRAPAAAAWFPGNVAVAMTAACRAAYELGRAIPESIDISDLRLPGRMQVIAERPLTLVDGTIHRHSAQQVAAWVRAFRHQARQSGREPTVGAVLSLPSDKDGEGVFEELAGLVDWVVLTRGANPHLDFSRDWSETARAYFGRVTAFDCVDDAVSAARAWVAPDDALLLLGTQSFVGCVLRLYGADTGAIWDSSGSGRGDAGRRSE